MQEVVELYPIIGKIKKASDIFKQIKIMHIDCQQENFILLCLNTKNKLIHSEIIFKGGLNTCTIDVRTIYRVALKYNSCNIIVAHNHPSTDLTPSKEDIYCYESIKRAGDMIGITCLDSVIFNDNHYHSMNEEELNKLL